MLRRAVITLCGIINALQLTGVKSFLTSIEHRVDVIITRVQPGRPGSAEALLQWPSFYDESSQNDDTIIAYEAQYAITGIYNWTSLDTTITGILEHPAPSSANVLEQQVIVTRVDPGQIITDGFIRLALSHSEITPPIPSDASAATMQAALEKLNRIAAAHVDRRVVSALTGELEWTILLDSKDGALPLLQLYAETISATYTGPGEQVMIQRLRQGASGTVVCSNECFYRTLSILPTGQLLSFRVRARYLHQGWSGWSIVTDSISVPSTMLPSSPGTPLFVSAAVDHLTIKWHHPNNSSAWFPVISYELQQQCGKDVGWHTVDATIRPSVTSYTYASSLLLEPYTSCIFRVAATTANGQGPYSPHSTRVTTLAKEPEPPLSVQLKRTGSEITGISWVPPLRDGGSAIVSYRVQYRTSTSSTWVDVPAAALDTARCICSFDALRLLPWTSYIFHVGATNAIGTSLKYTTAPEFRTEAISTLPHQQTSDLSDIPSDIVRFESAHQSLAANSEDIYYIHGTANGGRAIQQGDGQPGVVLLFPISSTGDRMEEQTYYYLPNPQTWIVPTAIDGRVALVAVDLYVWGGGGGSGGKPLQTTGDGGGGAFVQVRIKVQAGDVVDVVVGGGGEGSRSGRALGGTNGGGNGGQGNYIGGGGGGASTVLVNGKLVVVAAGGGGGGASSYCCSHGGGGGKIGENGVGPDPTTIPFVSTTRSPLDDSWIGRDSDHSALATGGQGATPSGPGHAGVSSSYVISRSGLLLPIETCHFQHPLLQVQSTHFAIQPSSGRQGLGGRGQGGEAGGGGGGGGFYGGGGGGSGMDGAGGGGGSSWISIENLYNSKQLLKVTPSQTVDQFTSIVLSSSSICLSWNAPPGGFSVPIEAFTIEIANRSLNEDFRVHRLIPMAQQPVGPWNITIEKLRPSTWYRFRIQVLFRDTIGSYSPIETVQTLAAPVNTWTRIGRVRPIGSDSISTPNRPSARRGHTLVTGLDPYIYLFGGYTKGYPCNQADKATCAASIGVTNEIWRFDALTKSWLLLHPVGGPPTARERHTMVMIAQRFLLFGGRQAGINDAISGLQDLWELTVSSVTSKTTVSLQDRQSNLPIQDGHELFTIGNVGAIPDMCVMDLTVQVQLTHACPSTLSIQLYGPGPSTFPGRQYSNMFPVDFPAQETTWSDSVGFGGGNQRRSTEPASTRSFPVVLQQPDQALDQRLCQSGPQKFLFSSTGTSALDSLSVFHQLSASGGWTLAITDTVMDTYQGTLTSWDINFTLSPCFPTYQWRDLSAIAIGTPPSARFQHSAIVYQSAMFIFGGRQSSDGRPLSDLYRLDYQPTGTSMWTTLVPMPLMERQFYHGRTLLVTPYELLSVGHGLRSRQTHFEPHSLSSNLVVSQKSVTQPLHYWHRLMSTPEDQPLGRYWSSAVYMTSSSSFLLFGGQDDTTLLDDLWEFDMTELASSINSAGVNRLRIEVCDWRMVNTAYQLQWTLSCGATAALVAASGANVCTIDTLLLYAWCNQQYQTIH